MASADISVIETAIEAMIRQQVAEYEVTLREKLAQKLWVGSSRRSKKKPTGQASRANRPRRSAEELAALSQRFVDAVEQAPGERMAVLSKSLGLRPADLAHPVLLLKKGARIKTVGERSRTRYYPMAAQAVA